MSHVKIDSPVFRLHTNATVILLITFSIAVTTRQYVGNPIDCVHTRWVFDIHIYNNTYIHLKQNILSFHYKNKKCNKYCRIINRRDIPEDVLNTYCWIHSTYTVVDAFMKKQGSEVPFPGVHNSQGRGPLTIKHTKYYQWVAFTLFFQVSTLNIFFLSRLRWDNLFIYSHRELLVNYIRYFDFHFINIRT